MKRTNATYEIHVHGDVSLRPGLKPSQIQEAVKPLWQYAGARSFAEGAPSAYEGEPGIRHDRKENTLQICWTVSGDDDFRQNLADLCMGLNEVASSGAVLEVSFFDSDFDDDDDDENIEFEENAESRDDFLMLFVGPTPEAIIAVQRELMVEDVVNLMERHFEPSELGAVVHEIDQLFLQRIENLSQALDLGRPPQLDSFGGHSVSGSGRKPRHLH